MKTRIILLIIGLVFCQAVLAQHLMEISGKVVTQKSEEALPFANIAAYAPNDSLTAGTLTDDHGRFTLKCDCSDSCYIIVSYLGMESKRITANQWQGTRRNLGKIALSPSAIMLGAVVVADTTPTIDRRFDRTVVKIEETRRATAHSIYDILRTLPGLAVDESGNMKYNGTTPAVYVDNTPSDLLYPVLENIPIDRIEKVELIDASVRQGGDGRGGIVNIKLRPADDGFSGSLSSKPSTYNFKEINDSKNSINLNYKQKKFIWVANSSFNTADKSWGYRTRKDFAATGNPIVLDEEQEADNHYRVSGNSLGFIFRPNDYTSLTVASSYSYSSSTKGMIRNMLERHGETGEIFSRIDFLGSDFQRSSPNYGFGISFFQQFKKSSSHYINASVFVSAYNDHFYGDYSERHSFRNATAIDSLYSERFDNHLSKAPTVYLNAYYNNPLTNNLNWSVNYTFDGTFNRKTSTERYSNDEILLPKSQKSNYHSAYNYLSSNLTYFSGNWRLTGGLSLEDKALNGQFAYFSEESSGFMEQRLSKNYFRVIPSTTVRYAFNWQHSISFTLANTWEYPYFEQLNDFIDKTTNFQWTTGNSDLKPSPNYSAFLNYELYQDKWSFSPSLFIKYQDDLMANIPIQIDPLTRLLYPVNIAQQMKVGLNLSADFKIKKLDVSVYSSFYYTQFSIREGLVFDDIDISNAYAKSHAINGYAYCNLSYKIKSVKLGAELDYWNTGAEFNGTSNDYVTLSITASRNFFKNRLLVNIGVQNLLRDLSSNTNHEENLGIITDTEIFGYYNQPTFNLSLQYNFKYGSRRTENVQGMRYF